MARKEPPKWTMILINHGAWILFVSFLILAVLAYIWGQFTHGDTIAIAIGIIVALAQVLLVYKLIEPTLDKIKEITSAERWKSAVREFLALCYMSARDLSRGLAYHIEDTDNGNGVLVLREGIVEVLQDIPVQAQAFDTMARLCSSAFSDEELADLSQISADLRSCAINASSAVRRLQLIDGQIRPFDEIKKDQKKLLESTYRRVDLNLYPEGVKRQCCWFVRDVDEIFEPMIEACRNMRSFVDSSRFAEGNRDGFIDESKRYERAKRKQANLTRARLEDEGLDGEELAEAIERELGLIEADIEQSSSAAMHVELIEKSIQELMTYNKRVEQKGICLAWLPDEPRREKGTSDELSVRA